MAAVAMLYLEGTPAVEEYQARPVDTPTKQFVLLVTLKTTSCNLSYQHIFSAGDLFWSELPAHSLRR